MNTLIVLTTASYLFLAGFNAETNPEAKILLSADKSQYATMTECKNAMKSLEDYIGVYKKAYPYEDQLYVSIVAQCNRVDADEYYEQTGKRPEVEF